LHANDFRTFPASGFSLQQLPSGGFEKSSSLIHWLPFQTVIVLVIGGVRMHSPVAVKIALLIAGRIGGKASSPKSVGGLSVFRK
jgi:hypothetical protein